VHSPETELAICRQNGKFVAGQLQTMHDLVETMEGIALIQQVQDSMPRNSPQWRQVDAAIKTQRIQLATESASVSCHIAL
jgi:ABC-type phosphate transport system auxiliary subunit